MGSRIQIAVLPNQVSTQGTGKDEGSGTEAGGVVPGCPMVTGHEPGDPERSTIAVASDAVGMGAVVQAPISLARRMAGAANEMARAVPRLRVTTDTCDELTVAQRRRMSRAA